MFNSEKSILFPDGVHLIGKSRLPLTCTFHVTCTVDALSALVVCITLEGRAILHYFTISIL